MCVARVYILQVDWLVGPLSVSLAHLHLNPHPSPTLSSNPLELQLTLFLKHQQFSLGFYTLLDAAVWSASPMNGSDNVHITFIDWLPFIFSALGMLIINSIEKSRLASDSFSYSGSEVAWKARVVLFLGFAFLAGGMAGGITVMVMKYVVTDTHWPTIGMGIANLVANGLVMLRLVVSNRLWLTEEAKTNCISSSVVLWISQNMEDEYSYNLAL